MFSCLWKEYISRQAFLNKSIVTLGLILGQPLSQIVQTTQEAAEAWPGNTLEHYQANY